MRSRRVLRRTRPRRCSVARPDTTEFCKRLAQAGRELGELLAQKNASYGSAFALAGDFLRLLYPSGLRPDQYQDALILVRAFDKMCRIATSKSAFGESPYRDLAGYALLGAVSDESMVGTDPTAPITPNSLPAR